MDIQHTENGIGKIVEYLKKITAPLGKRNTGRPRKRLAQQISLVDLHEHGGW